MATSHMLQYSSQCASTLTAGAHFSGYLNVTTSDHGITFLILTLPGANETL